ncbi:MAG: hypothetical protein RLZZ599_1251 [Bacteroidota bacterium]
MKKIDPFYALQAGWVRYKNKAGMYTAYTIVFFIASVLIAQVATGLAGMLGFMGVRLSTLIMSLVVGAGSMFLSMGFAHVARMDERGESVEFGDFFHAFKVNQKQLFGVVLITTLIGQIGGFFMPEEIGALATGQLDFNNLDEVQMMFEDMAEIYVEHSGIIVLVALIQIVFGVGFMFSTYRASMEGDELMEALQWSFPRAWKNFLRLLVLGIMVFVIAMVMSLITFFIGLLAIIPWLILVQYDIYDQLCDKPEGVDPIVEEFDYDN